MGGIRNFFCNDVADFGQLAHKVGLRVQPAGGIEYQVIGVSCQGGFTGVKGHGSRVGTTFLFNNLHVDTLCPDC